MATIEEKARECAFKTHPIDYIKRKAYIAGYIQGAKNELILMAKWHDPKEELPPKDINSGVSYLLKIEDEDGDIMYRVGARMPNSNKFIYSGTGHNTTVLGWREIIDEGKV